MPISETIALEDQVSQAAMMAAGAVDSLSHAFAAATVAAQQAGAVGAQAAQAVAAATAAEKAGLMSAADAAKMKGQAELAASKAAERATLAENKALAAQSKLQDKVAKNATKSTKGTMGQSKAAQFLASRAGVAGGALKSLGSAGLLAGGAIGVGLIVTKLIDAAAEAAKTKDQMRGMLNVLTQGRGGETLAQLENMAKKLGIPVEKAVDEFHKLRDAGASNKDAVASIKLLADIDATSGPEMAAKAMEKLAKAAKEGKALGPVLQELAKDFGVTGTGANAAAASALTLAGRWQSIKDRLSEAGVKILEALTPVFEGIASGVEFVVALLPDIGAALDDVAETMKRGAVRIVEAFAEAGSAVSNFWSQVTSFGDVGKLESGMADAAAGAAAPFLGFDTQGMTAGQALAAGVAHGIDANKAQAIGAALAMSSEIVTATNAALGIHSPSKEGQWSAKMYVKGFTDPIENADAPEMPAPQVPAMAGGAAPGRSVTQRIEFNINVRGGDTAEENARAMRREATMLINQLRFSGLQ